ncbi:hypothetical protein JAAARDRAFT_189794 [Jaapia argillacea MUCL 33604]|uniref:Uncharacterized protein n=1 Tax=Jaapia argillacea MUCL 33604 TaxID=933084 RepID=A0A067QG54_9AGAM|nr:hypothetical protein JAAARDRAFT_189794 [Jaapia argillacea MUCL 33604]
MSRLSLFRYVSVIDKLNAFGAQILDLTAYPLLVSPSNSEEVAKAIAEQRKEALIVLLAFFAIQINLEDKAGAFVTFTLISLALTLRIYLENIPVETTLVSLPLPRLITIFKRL